MLLGLLEPVGGGPIDRRTGSPDRQARIETSGQDGSFRTHPVRGHKKPPVSELRLLPRPIAAASGYCARVRGGLRSIVAP